MTVARLPGRMAGGSTGPGGSPSWIVRTIFAGQGACGSASIRCHAAVISSAHGQVAWIFRRRRRPPRTRRAAACSTGRSVLGSALARSPSRVSSLSQASRICPVIEAVSHAALIPKSKEEMADSAVLPGADRILDPGVDPVGGVDVGGLAEPASGVGEPVRGPQGVPPAVPGLEQGQLRAGMRPLPAREDPHRRGPVGFQNSATGADLGFYAARSYSLMRPPRTGRRWIRSGHCRVPYRGGVLALRVWRLRVAGSGSRGALAVAFAGWAVGRGL